MAIADERLIEILVNEDDELRQQVENHKNLDTKIKELNRRRYLTPQEETERKILQKRKLIGKDKIHSILFQYKNNERVIF